MFPNIFFEPWRSRVEHADRKSFWSGTFASEHDRLLFLGCVLTTLGVTIHDETYRVTGDR